MVLADYMQPLDLLETTDSFVNMLANPRNTEMMAGMTSATTHAYPWPHCSADIRTAKRDSGDRWRESARARARGVPFVDDQDADRSHHKTREHHKSKEQPQPRERRVGAADHEELRDQERDEREEQAPVLVFVGPEEHHAEEVAIHDDV